MNKQFEERKSNLNKAFSIEFSLYHNYLSDAKKSELEVRKLIPLISQVPFMDFELELSPNNSIIFTLQLKENTFMYITKSFNEIDVADDEVIYGLYVKRQCIVNSAGPISDVIQSAKEIVNPL